jgi:hypothetical protein
MHQQFNIQQLYVLPTLYLCVLYVEINQPNALKLYISLFFLTTAPTCFGKTMPSSASEYFPVWATSASIW